MVSSKKDNPQRVITIKIISPATIPRVVKKPWIKPPLALLADTVNTLRLGIDASIVIAPNKPRMLAQVILKLIFKNNVFLTTTQLKRKNYKYNTEILKPHYS